MGRDRPCWGGGCGTERVREGLPVKIPISRSGGGGYFRGWLAKCDNLSSMENLGSLNKYEDPSVGEGPLGKEASNMLVEKESRTSVYQA